MSTYLKVVAVGNLGSDPEVRDLQSGGCVTQFSIAHNERWKDKDGEQQERVEWVRIKCFGKLAEICADHLKKGRQVLVEGTMRTDKYTDKEGIERYATDVIADEVRFLGSPAGERNDRNDRDDRSERGGRYDRGDNRGSRSGGGRGSDRGGDNRRSGGYSRGGYGRTGTDPT